MRPGRGMEHAKLRFAASEAAEPSALLAAGQRMAVEEICYGQVERLRLLSSDEMIAADEHKLRARNALGDQARVAGADHIARAGNDERGRTHGAQCAGDVYKRQG